MKRSSVLLFIRPSVPSIDSSGEFAAEHSAGRRYRSTAACAAPRVRAACALSSNGAAARRSLSKCGQCHVDSRGTMLNTDVLANEKHLTRPQVDDIYGNLVL